MTTTTTTTINTQITRRPLWAGLVLAMALLLTVPAAFADTYRGNSYHGDHSYHHPTPKPVKVASTRPGRRYHYSVGYRDGNGGFSWLNYRRGEDNSSGYTGSYASDNRPHRSDWEAKLRDQRKWDEEQYAKMQGDDNGKARCGFTGAPAYCYRLLGPYPTEMKVVRY